MKHKELKQIAQKIAQAEQIIQTSNDKSAILKAQGDIEKLTSGIDNFSDLILIDELVQEIFEKKLD